MKKGTFAMLVFLIIGSFSYGQYTATLSNRTASPNDTVKVNLNVTGLNTNNIASIQFYIQIDPSVLTFQNVTNFPQPGLMVGFINGNTVTMVWTNPSPKNFPNGTLLTLNFKYHGLSSPVSFIPSSCEVVKLVGGIPVILNGTFTDGSVSPFLNNSAKAKLDSLLNAPLGIDTIHLKYTGFTGNDSLVGAITQRISYDPSKLTYIGVTGTGNLSTGFTANLSAGIITITWYSVTGKNINFPGSRFNILFNYIIASASSVSFSTGCVIETKAPVTNIPVTYFDGYISPPPVVTSYATLGTVTGAIQGQTIDVPLTLSSMPSNTSNFNLNILFDSPRLAFIGILNPVQPVNANQNGNIISITNTNPMTSLPSINTQFLILRFVYQGVGIANVNFTSGCQFSNGAPIGVGYTNGSVTPGVVPGDKANIGYVTSIASGAVAIPVTFSEMPTNIGAVTLFIGFDATKLTYTGALNPYNTTIQPTGNIVKISWFSQTPVNLNNSAFVTLQFNYISGSGSNCSASVFFTDGCQIANTSGTLVPTNWYDGGVNVKFKVSGTIKYDNPPFNTPLGGFIVKLKLGDNNIAETTSTSSGNFEMWAANGSYIVDAEQNSTSGYFSDENDAQQIIFYAGGWGWPEINALRLFAGDVNEDGITDENDAQLINFRAGGWPYLPAWSLPDWVFGGLNTVEKSVTIGCSDISNVELYGLCSGNVTGSYIP